MSLTVLSIRHLFLVRVFLKLIGEWEDIADPHLLQDPQHMRGRDDDADKVDAELERRLRDRPEKSPDRRSEVVKRWLATSLRTYHTVVGARIALHAGGPIVLIVLSCESEDRSFPIFVSDY